MHLLTELPHQQKLFPTIPNKDSPVVVDFPLGTAPHHRLRQSELDLSILGSEKMGRQQVELSKKGWDDFQSYWGEIGGIQSYASNLGYQEKKTT